MQQLTAVLAAVGSAIVVLAGYHALIAGPALRKIGGTIDTHGSLLGGGGSSRAVDTVAALEARIASVESTCSTDADRIAALERVARAEVPRIGFVRYNAFDDVGSDLSYALALLTREGDGVVLSSIYSREETRTYGKAVERFQTAQDASSEEKAAIAKARGA